MQKTTKVRLWLFGFILTTFSFITGAVLISNNNATTQHTSTTSSDIAITKQTTLKPTQTNIYTTPKTSASTRSS